MDQREQDRYTLVTLIRRSNTVHFPRARSIKARLENEDTLSASDLAFLHTVLDSVRTTFTIIERNAEYHDITVKGLAFYNEILQLAIDNEKVDKS